MVKVPLLGVELRCMVMICLSTAYHEIWRHYFVSGGIFDAEPPYRRKCFRMECPGRPWQSTAMLSGPIQKLNRRSRWPMLQRCQYPRRTTNPAEADSQPQLADSDNDGLEGLPKKPASPPQSRAQSQHGPWLSTHLRPQDGVNIIQL